MSKQTVAVLAAVLFVLLLLVVVGQRSDTGSADSGTVLVPDLGDALADLERVTVVKANNETVAVLERQPERWIVASKHGYAADSAKLRQALTALSEASVLEQKTANAALYDRLGVEDVAATGAAGISVAMAAPGHELPSIILGNAEGSRYRYARRAGEAQSFLIDRNPDVPRTAAQWLESRIVDVRSERVREVTIRHADGETVQISKDSPELANFEVANVPEGRELSYPGVANVIGNALRELNLEDVEPAAQPAEGETTTVEYRTFNGLVVRVTGIEREDGNWITLEASADTSAQSDASENESSTADAAAPAAATDDNPAAEAERINARVGGWRYKIASFQYDQMTRRLDELLKPPPAA